MKRVFIAINLPEETKKELGNLEKEIAQIFPEENKGLFRWVKKDNLHLTLLFLGSVRDDEIPKICEAVMETVQEQASFSLRVKKVCYGPPKTMPPRLIWLEIEKNQQLAEIAKKLEEKILKSGILQRAENRPFSPHITLARLSAWHWRRINPEERPEIEKEINLSFRVDSIEVMESVLKRAGTEYKIIKLFLLSDKEK